MRYSNAGQIKSNGVIYTPKELAEYVSNEIVSHVKKPYDSQLYILDPAIGRGELIISMIQALRCKGYRNFCVVGYETDSHVCISTHLELVTYFPNIKIEIRQENFLEACTAGIHEKYDIIIANPPYVRTQIMGSNIAQDIAKQFQLTGRVDLYYGFLICVKQLLKSDGIAGYITSNKFLTIKSGTTVRNFMIENYKIYKIIDFGDTKLFSAAVLPCVILFSLGTTNFPKDVSYTSIYEGTDDGQAMNAASIFEIIEKEGIYKLANGAIYKVMQGWLRSTEQNALWTISSAETQRWLQQVELNTHMHFSDIGTIRVGIKTTADSIFIGPQEKWNMVGTDLEWLRPLITHRNAGKIIPNMQEKWQVLYTHTVVHGKKQVRNIQDSPKTKAYLEGYYKQLSARKYIIKAKRKWYEIWVPQNPMAWQHRKIVFRDIAKEPQFWLDESGAVVNGDCYWIDIFPGVSEDLVYLVLAIANSKFIEKFYDAKFNTKLYAGKRRYMTQYVEQFPIPDKNSILAQEAITLVKSIISTNKVRTDEQKRLNQLVDMVFCIYNI